MIKAVIFDMDGVIADTQQDHARLEVEIFKRYGVDMSPEEVIRRFSGVRIKDSFKEVLNTQDKPYDLDALVLEKRQRMMDLAEEAVRPIPGSVVLIEHLHKQGFLLGVGTSSTKRYADKILKTLGVHHFFKGTACGDMVEHGKPHPDIFLLAAKQLEVDAKECVVIEDGVSGMEAAKRAGMKCIGLVEDLKGNYPTKHLVTDLSEITDEYVRGL